MSALLTVRDLGVRHDDGTVALRGVDLDLDRGATLVVVGESGAGKSTLARCLTGTEPAATGSVRLDAAELVGAAEESVRPLRGEVVALALQGAPLHPVRPLGETIAEPLRIRRRLPRGRAADRAEQLARETGLDPGLLGRLPHEVSGGQRRRAALATALALDPVLLVLDEPTAGLDPVTAAALVARLATLPADRRCALLVITHDLGVAARLGGRTAVLYAGAVVEQGPTGAVLDRPRHPYTAALVAARPTPTSTRDLTAIRGLPPDPRRLPDGCAFAPRCPQAEPVCAEPVRAVPHPADPDGDGADRVLACHLGGRRVLLRAEAVSAVHGRGRRTRPVLHGIDLTVGSGESVGLLGPSGSGKTTLVRVITGLHPATAGRLTLRDTPLPGPRAERHRVQLVAQDPRDAVAGHMSVGAALSEPLRVRGRTGAIDPATGFPDVLPAALADVGLPATAEFLATGAHRLSGGQLQRLALARALLAEPEVLVADEPTSLLDPSEQARLVQVLRERQVQRGLGLLFVSHDIALLSRITDRVLVLEEGRIVEQGPPEQVCVRPRSVTARRLLAAAVDLAPSPDRPSHPRYGGTHP